MIVQEADIIRPAPPPVAMDALAYEAPFLIDKLVKDRIVDTASEAEALFDEVKKYIVLARSDESVIWEMYSLRVDEAWHQFILFTAQYIDFCKTYFGGYVQHSPSNAPKPKIEKSAPISTFGMFRARYRQLFGTELPDIWFDARTVTLRRRVFNDRAGALKVRDQGAMLDLVTAEGETLMSINAFAREAMAFVARTGVFFVRELPGGLTEEEKIALVGTMVEYGILRVGG